MGIKKVYSDEPRAGWKFDAKRGKYFTYKIDVYFGARRIREKGFQTKSEAESVIAKLKLLEKEKKFDLPHDNKGATLKYLFEKRLASLTSPKQKELEKRVLQYFSALIPGDLKITEITTSHLQEFVKVRRTEKTIRGTLVKMQTVDRELTVIAAVLHSAAEFFHELENWVCPKIPRPKTPKRGRERVVTDAEKNLILNKLLADRSKDESFFAWKARLRVGQIFQVAFQTGMRHGEIMQLRWSEYNEKAKSLRVVRSKTDSISYLSPLPESVMNIFSSRRAESENDFIFTKSGKTPPNFYRILKDACKAVGVQYGRYTTGGIILHDARHTFTTKLQQAGIDLATIQSFTGHSDKELVMRYSHARPESRKRAMQAIEAIETNSPSCLENELKEIYNSVQSGKLQYSEFVIKIEVIGTNWTRSI
jgi:integrase